jgi:DNA-binding LytR/AlgR family response regulator
MRNILIIEDDADLCENIKQIFEFNNFKVITALNGAEGIKIAKKKIPDVILCDIKMPGIDGYDVKKNLGSDPSTISIPFIFLSGKAELKDIKYGLELGADDYIIKPFNIDDLYNTVENRLNRIKELNPAAPKANADNVTLGKTKKRLTELEQILVYIKGEPEIIKIADIVVIYSAGDYSNVICIGGEEIQVRKLLKEWEKMLPEQIFFRARNNTIINLRYIIKLEKWFSRTIMIKLKNITEPVIVSQRMSKKLKSKLKF